VQTRRPIHQSDHVPSSRALAAIGEAARRSREAGVGPEPARSHQEEASTHGVADEPVTAPATSQVPRRVRVNATAWPGRDPDAPEGRSTAPLSGGIRWVKFPPPPGPAGFAESPAGVPRRRTRPSGSVERRLRWAIGITVGALVIVVAALVATVNQGDRQPDDRAATTAGSARAASSTAPGGSTGTTSGQGAVSSTSTSTTLAEPGGPPDLSALAPASGHAGQTVTVIGSNFLSSSGQISAQVGGQVAPVACPDLTTCTVVLPPDPGSTAPATVTITTDSGTSNALVFTYG
jgi:hypothetical protein